MKPLVSDALWKRWSPCCHPRLRAASASRDANPWTTARSSPASCSCSRPASPGTTCPPTSAAAAARPAGPTLQAWQQAGVWRQLHAVLLAELKGADAIDSERALIDASFAGPGRGRGYRPESDGPEQIRQQAPRDDRRPRRAAGGDGDRRQRPRDHPGLHDGSTTCRRWAASRDRSGRSPTACRGIGASRLGTGAAGFAKPGATPVLAARNTEHGSGLGKSRWYVERTIAWLHSFGRLRRRLDRLTEIQDASFKLACSLICLRLLGQ